MNINIEKNEEYDFEEFKLLPLTVKDLRWAQSMTTKDLGPGAGVEETSTLVIMYLLQKKGRFDGKKKTMNEIEGLPVNFYLLAYGELSSNYPVLMGL